MSDEQIEYLKSCLQVGLLVLIRADVAQHEPGSLSVWTTAYQVVSGVGMAEDEPVAFFGDKGHYAALWVSSPDDFIIANPVNNWPTVQNQPEEIT